MDEITATMVKALGAAGGAFLALVFQPPSDFKDLIVRGVFAFFSGVLFGEPIRDQYLHWPNTWPMWLGSASLVALASWWIWGAAVRILSRWTPK